MCKSCPEAWTKQATHNMHGGDIRPSSTTRMPLGIHIYTSNHPQQAIQNIKKRFSSSAVCLTSTPSPLSSQPRLPLRKTHPQTQPPLKERRGDNHGIHPVSPFHPNPNEPRPRNSQPDIKSERKRKERKELAVQKKIVKKG